MIVTDKSLCWSNVDTTTTAVISRSYSDSKSEVTSNYLQRESTVFDVLD
jgi:hypothetical protein